MTNGLGETNKFDFDPNAANIDRKKKNTIGKMNLRSLHIRTIAQDTL